MVILLTKFFKGIFFALHSPCVISNVLKTGPFIEPEMLTVHGSLVEPVVEPRSDR